MKTFTKELQENMSPQAAIDRLKEGNKRFVDRKKAKRDLLLQMDQTSTGQFPFAALQCYTTGNGRLYCTEEIHSSKETKLNN